MQLCGREVLSVRVRACLLQTREAECKADWQGFYATSSRPALREEGRGGGGFYIDAKGAESPLAGQALGRWRGVVRSGWVGSRCERQESGFELTTFQRPGQRK